MVQPLEENASNKIEENFKLVRRKLMLLATESRMMIFFKAPDKEKMLS